MFTVTPDDFLNLHDGVSFEDFLSRLGCSDLRETPVFKFTPHSPRTQALTTLFNIYIMVHARGLTQNTLGLSEINRGLTELVKQGGPDLSQAYVRMCDEMFEEGVRDRTNIRYLVSEDVDYGNWFVQGLFISLEGANKCGERLVSKGSNPHSLKVDVMVQRP